MGSRRMPDAGISAREGQCARLPDADGTCDRAFSVECEHVFLPISEVLSEIRAC